MNLPLDDIQGNITPGFRKSVQAFLLFKFQEGASGEKAARAWIEALRPLIATSEEVATFNSLFLMVKKRWPRGESRVIRSTWVNVGFSSNGLRRLVPEAQVKEFRPPFWFDPEGRAQDLGEQQVRHSYEFGGAQETEPDVILIIGADSCRELWDEIRKQFGAAAGKLAPLGLPRIGETLGNGREHFGFRDGLTRPDPEDPRKGWDWHGPNNPVVAPGEFILGLQREGGGGQPGPATFYGPIWARHGSFLVFRQLQQRVKLFEKEVDDAWAAVQLHRPAVTRDQVKARLMGRWPSGVKLTFAESAGAATDPGDAYKDPAEIPSWMIDIWGEEFTRDVKGAQCPLFAHVRKAHPRNRDDARLHRIIRRGITYGPKFDATRDQVERDRGLYFVAYQADIGRQFRTIQKAWLTSSNNADDGTPGTGGRPQPGPDPIAGVREPGRSPKNNYYDQGAAAYVTLDYPKEPVTPQPVTVRGSAYFFVPSISALAMLARDA